MIAAEHPAFPSIEPRARATPICPDRALDVVRRHYAALGWRPVSLRSPRTEDRAAKALLMLDGNGRSTWVCARDWSESARAVAMFRSDMARFRVARADDAMLVFDGEFPEAVVEAAAAEPGLRLIDAATLRSMATAAPRPIGARLAQPARTAARAMHDRVARAMDDTLLPATERYFSPRFARALRTLDGERRQVRRLATATLLLMGLAAGFLLFNAVLALRDPAPAGNAARDEAASSPAPLPAPEPPPQGYVAATVGAPDPRAAYVSPYANGAAPARPAAAVAPMIATMAATPAAAVVAGSDRQDLEGSADAARRADEAMRVIAADTPELRRNHGAPPADSALVDGAPATADAAAVESGAAAASDAEPMPR